MALPTIATYNYDVVRNALNEHNIGLQELAADVQLCREIRDEIADSLNNIRQTVEEYGAATDRLRVNTEFLEGQFAQRAAEAREDARGVNANAESLVRQDGALNELTSRVDRLEQQTAETSTLVNNVSTLAAETSTLGAETTALGVYAVTLANEVTAYAQNLGSSPDSSNSVIDRIMQAISDWFASIKRFFFH